MKSPPKDMQYNRENVCAFRSPFLEKRLNELQKVMKVIATAAKQAGNDGRRDRDGVSTEGRRGNFTSPSPSFSSVTNGHACPSLHSIFSQTQTKRWDFYRHNKYPYDIHCILSLLTFSIYLAGHLFGAATAVLASQKLFGTHDTEETNTSIAPISTSTISPNMALFDNVPKLAGRVLLDT